jgi:uncharacterized protein YgbK (DUF1537 family)
VRRLAAVQEDPTPAPDGPAPQGTAGLEATLATLDANLRQLDVELQAAERARDTANHALAGQPTALEAWGLEEQREAAEGRITQLLEQRWPLADRHARLLGHLTPRMERQREIAEQEAVVETIQRLLPVLGILDEAVRMVDSAQPAAARSGKRMPVPAPLRRLAREWRDDGRANLVGCGAARYATAYQLDLAAATERLQRLKAGVS